MVRHLEGQDLQEGRNWSGISSQPGRDRFQKVVNGVTEDWYRIVPAVQPSNPLKGFVDTPKEEGSSGDLRELQPIVDTLLTQPL